MASVDHPRETLIECDRAEQAGADPDECAAQRWYCWMMLGDFERAWRESDAIARRNVQVANCFWDGQPFDGKRVMVRSLHGYGDAVQFMRYLPLLRARASRVIVETHPQLVSLVRAQPCVDEAIAWGEASSEWDQQIELMEFPRAFRSTIETIPREAPYLRVPSGLVRGNGARPRVGIVWGASDWEASRSMPVQLLRPLLAVPGVSFFSFQHGRHRSELPRGVEDTADDCPDILSTATALTRMDLVITVDTLAAHLAGALGIEVWTLLQYRADWRWMIDREDSPWYPSMRLFRQSAPGDWEGVMGRVSERVWLRRGEM